MTAPTKFLHSNVLIQQPFQVPAMTQQDEYNMCKNLGLHSPSDFKIIANPKITKHNILIVFQIP